jgi:hypothetical protein
MHEELKKAKLREHIADVKTALADAEVRLLLPPADCSEPVLFENIERERIRWYQAMLTDYQSRLERLEGQRTFSFVECRS